MPESHANTFYDALWHCQYVQKRKLPAALAALSRRGPGSFFRIEMTIQTLPMFTTKDLTVNWCCFYYFVRNNLVSLLEALSARIPFCRFVNIGFSWHFVFFFSFLFFCARPLSLKIAFFPPLSTRLLCLVVAISLVCWLYMCFYVCVPLYVHCTRSKLIKYCSLHSMGAIPLKRSWIVVGLSTNEYQKLIAQRA